MAQENWYATLMKPEWAPPAWLFGPVWSFLYVVIFITYGYVLYTVVKKQVPAKVLTPFILNLIFNFAFTPLQFGLKNNIFAFFDIIFVLGTIVWMFIVVWPYSRWVVYANIPYFLWVSFATVLQATITFLNL